MSKLLKRVQKLEALLTDVHGLVPHSEEWFEYWGAKIERTMAGEDVDLRGLTLEFVDALLAKVKEATGTDEDTRGSTAHA